MESYQEFELVGARVCVCDLTKNILLHIFIIKKKKKKKENRFSSSYVSSFGKNVLVTFDKLSIYISLKPSQILISHCTSYPVFTVTKYAKFPQNALSRLQL